MIVQFMNIDAEIMKELVQSIPRHLKAVVDAKGYPTKQLFKETLEYLLICRDFFYKCIMTFVR